MKNKIQISRFILTLLISSIALAEIPAGYYNNADGLSGEALKTALHNIIDGHTTFSYDDLWTTLVETDEDPDNSSNFILLYTGRSLAKTAVYPAWNREHSWPKSHGDFGETPPAGTDMHHLRPTDVDVNSRRGNLDYDDGGSLVSGTTDCYADGDSFEPRDEVKGDCARMMFYMATRYEGDGSEPDLELVDYTGTSGAILGKLSTLIAWHNADPVDDFEKDRNDKVYSYQNNRNPFIDHPEYVAYIWSGEVPSGISAPTAQSATDITLTSFTANWSSVASATGYKLYVATDVNFSGPLSGYNPKDLTTLSESISGLSSETTYYYKIKAYNSEDESAFSNIISVETTTTPPAGDGDGTYTKITDINNLTNGHYIIAHSADDFAMNSTNAGKYFTHTSISPSDNTISDPDQTIVWKLEKTGEYWTIYHEVEEMYVNCSGEKNVNFQSEGTSDGELWAITYINDEFRFTSKFNTAYFLQYNSSAPRFTSYKSTSNQNDLSLYKLASETALPITLTSFSAKAKTGLVELTWETASETNNAAYIIYRNGEAFAQVAGSGTTSETQNYTYTDATVIPGITYTYVLADLDFANTLTRYDDKALTVTVGKNILEADFTIGSAYPNPFNPCVTINYQLSTINEVRACIYDMNGTLVQELLNKTVSAGDHSLTWNASDMPSGVYIIKTKIDNIIHTQKIAFVK